MRRLFVGNLHVNVMEDDLRTVFEPFGAVDRIDMQLDDSGRSKGFAFVHFVNGADGTKAMSRLNGLELAGKPMKVGVVNETASGSGAGGYTGGGGGGDNGNWKLEDDDGAGGLALGAQHRAMLMAKLACNTAMPAPASATPLAVPMSMAQPVFVPPTKVPVMGTPSPCVQLKNMFDPASETEDGWDLDIREDVQEECSNHGAVLHVHVDKNSLGHVYLKMDSVDAATKVANTLNGRFFAGKMISVAYIPVSDYHSRFPGSEK